MGYRNWIEAKDMHTQQSWKNPRKLWGKQNLLLLAFLDSIEGQTKKPKNGVWKWDVYMYRFVDI